MGFKVTVEDSKCVQANAFIQEGLFHEFVIKEDQIIFKINLTVLLVGTIHMYIYK
jgi:cell cycle checkpoint protein